MVVTPGVASARSNPLSFTTIPMISGGSEFEGREAHNFAITSSLSAICLTCFGDTKLTASMCLNPARTSSFRYSALYSVGMKSCSPCQASLGHSINFTDSICPQFDYFAGWKPDTPNCQNKKQNSSACSVSRWDLVEPRPCPAS